MANTLTLLVQFKEKNELNVALNKLGDPFNEIPTENQPAGGITFE